MNKNWSCCSKRARDKKGNRIKINKHIIRMINRTIFQTYSLNNRIYTWMLFHFLKFPNYRTWKYDSLNVKILSIMSRAQKMNFLPTREWEITIYCILFLRLSFPGVSSTKNTYRSPAPAAQRPRCCTRTLHISRWEKFSKEKDRDKRSRVYRAKLEWSHTRKRGNFLASLPPIGQLNHST